MKRLLLTGVALAALAIRPAAAQFAVHDAPSNLLRVAEAARALEQGMQLVHQGEMAYQAVTRVTDLGTAVSALSMLGIQNPLPVNPYALQGLLNGTGGVSGMLGNLSGLYNGALASNTVYQSPGDTWIGQQINAMGGGIAGAQAVALQLHQSAAERVPLLNELQARINEAPDPSEREALIARFGAENAYIQNQQVQAQALGAFTASQLQLRDQQREERLLMSIAEARAAIQAGAAR